MAEKGELVALEIERRFLVRNDEWRRGADIGREICEGYLTGSSNSSVRIRIGADQPSITVEGAATGIIRQEFEYPVPATDAEQMIDQLCTGCMVRKCRYRLFFDLDLWEIDVYQGDNQGLVLAEIELRSAGQTILRPDWLGDEVSSDPRYFSVRLATTPWRRWASA